MSPHLQRLTILLMAGLLSACASLSAQNDPAKWPPERFYEDAQQALKIGDYQNAIKQLEELEKYHPFSPYTQQGQLEQAYAYYKYDEPDNAIASADRFIKLYPRHPNVDYAYYIKGLASYDRGLSNLDHALGLDPADRDPKAAHEAFQYFSELVTRFPASRYVADANQRMIYLREMLARHEVTVAEYYLRRGAPIAAANRARYTVENFPQTPAVIDALAIMSKAYQHLGLNDLAQDTDEVLRLNRAKQGSAQ